MGYLSRSNEPEKEIDEIVMDALTAFNRRPKYVDTSAHRHKTIASRIASMLAFQKPNPTTGAAGKPDETGQLPARELIQGGYENL